MKALKNRKLDQFKQFELNQLNLRKIKGSRISDVAPVLIGGFMIGGAVISGK